MLHSSTIVSHPFSSQRFDEESALELGFVVEDDDDLEDLATRSPVVRIPTHHLDPSTHILFSAGQYHWACRSRQNFLVRCKWVAKFSPSLTFPTYPGDSIDRCYSRRTWWYHTTHCRLPGDPITFIDAPGHAAFTNTRERGANITDIVIHVIAADDGVKQQTKDSIVCARQAGVPPIVVQR